MKTGEEKNKNMEQRAKAAAPDGAAAIGSTPTRIAGNLYGTTKVVTLVDIDSTSGAA